MLVITQPITYHKFVTFSYRGTNSGNIIFVAFNSTNSGNVPYHMPIRVQVPIMHMGIHMHMAAHMHMGNYN